MEEILIKDSRTLLVPLPSLSGCYCATERKDVSAFKEIEIALAPGRDSSIDLFPIVTSPTDQMQLKDTKKWRKDTQFQ